MDEQNLDQDTSEQPVSQPSTEPSQPALEEVSQAPISQPAEVEVPEAAVSTSEPEKAPVDLKWKKPVILMLIIGVAALLVSFILNIG